jgi:mono/diheme cytochrome c family protein
MARVVTLYAFRVVPLCVSAAWLAAAPQNPRQAGSNPALSAAGAALFQQSCASCHGDVSRAPSLAHSLYSFALRE